MKLISIVIPCYNEEENVGEIYRQVRKVFSKHANYRYEHIFIDNASTDRTLDVLKDLARKDKRVKIIVNARNFGWIKSQYYALTEARGDAVVLLVADLQDPPELITEFIRQWEKGYKAVVGIKKHSEEGIFMGSVRKLYYKLVSSIAETELLENFTGFGLYDKKIINILKGLADPYPYFRGLVSEFGHPMKSIEYTQNKRNKGKTKADFFMLLDVALLGIMSYSRLPLRIITISGLILSVLSFLISLIYLCLKIFLWSSYPLGTATLVIGLFFFSSVQLLFIGVMGEYIGLIHTRTIKRPLVVERERVNF
jgi:polyisoprenyl-phosphate glycosyltransferase